MIFKGLLNKIYPLPPVGGLEITDTALRLTEFVKGRPTTEVYRLPPGVVEKGEVKNKESFTRVLKELRDKASGKGKLAVVLTLPVAKVFIQTVKLPPAAGRNLEEAASLNVQMVSPLKQGEFYYDWQRVSKDEAPGTPIELLAAFVAKETVDSFSRALSEAGLSLVAVEFVSLSLTRELVRQKVLQPGEVYLAAEIKPEGTTLALIRDNALLFHSFHALASDPAVQISVQDFVNTLREEIQNISNFYLAHWGGAVNNLIFISSSLIEEIKQTFKERSLIVLNPEEVAPATGAAMRQILGEKEISLLGTSSLAIYEESRALTFVSLWRTVLVSTLIFLIALALGTDIFLRQLAKKEMEVNALTLNEPGHRELLALREEASKFNNLIALIKEAREDKSDIGRLARIVNNLAGVEIRITRFALSSPGDPITVTGVAENEQAAIAFKNRLAAEKVFSAVELPISDIAPEAGGKVRFTIYLKFNLAK